MLLALSAVSALPLPVNTPVLAVKLGAVTVPFTDRALEVLLKVNPLLEPAFPSLLKMTSVFEPVTAKLPEILPTTLAKTNGAVILPVVSIVPLPNIAFAVALPTVNPVSTPTLVMLGCALVVTEPAVVALVAEPVNAPTNVVDVTLASPAIVFVVLPSASVVLPNIIFEFANLVCANVPVEILLALSAANALPLPVNTPVLAVKLGAVTVPFIDNELERLLNEKALLEPAFPSLLNITSPFEPVTAKLPEILPTTLAKTKGAVILPVVSIVPLPNTAFAVALPTVNPVKVPTEVIFG